MNPTLSYKPAGWWRPAAGPAVGTPAAATDDKHPKGKLAFRALLLLTFIVVLAPQHFVTALQPLRIAFLAAAVAGAAYLLQRIAHRQPLLELNREVKVTGLLVAWAIVTVPFSYWAGGSVQFLFGVWFKTLIVFLLLANVIDTRARLVKVAWALVLMSIPLALSGIRNYLSGAYVSDRIVGYEGGLTANPNDLALMLNLILPLGIALFLSAKRMAAKALLVGILGLSTVAIVVTFSRSGFLTLALIGAIYTVLLFRRRRTGLAVAAIVVALAALPLIPTTYLERIATITSIEADETGSSQARWADTIAALRYVGANPLVGAGVGQNALAMNEIRGEEWLRVHNVYLEYAVELGIPGGVLYIMLLVGSISAARTAQRRAAAVPRDDGFEPVAQAVWVALVAFSFAALFYPAGYQFYFFLFAGLALAARSISAPAPEVR